MALAVAGRAASRLLDLLGVRKSIGDEKLVIDMVVGDLQRVIE
jgi:hypothetical protein